MARRKIEPPKPGHVVKEVWKDGKLLGKICDDAYRDLTPEQIEERRERIRANCERIWSEAIAAGRVKNPEKYGITREP